MIYTPFPIPGFMYSSQMFVQDDFVSGNATSGSIGALGWIATSGTTSVVASEVNHPGVIRRDTTASSGTIAQFLLGFTSSEINPAVTGLLTVVARLNTNDANTTLRIGASAAFSQNPPNHGVYFEKLDGDTNIFCVTRASSTETRTNSGVAMTTGWITYQYARTLTGVSFYLNGSLVATHTTNIPTSFINPGAHIVNSTTAAKTVDIDYFECFQFGPQR